jgi:hypothetical protein
VAMAEVKSILPEANPHYHGHEHQNADQPGELVPAEGH